MTKGHLLVFPIRSIPTRIFVWERIDKDQRGTVKSWGQRNTEIKADEEKIEETERLGNKLKDLAQRMQAIEKMLDSF